METSPFAERPAHISIPLEPSNSSAILPPSPDSTYHTHTRSSPQHHLTTSTMHSDPFYSASAYPRAADSDSESTHSDNSTHKIEEEDPLYSLPTSQAHSSPPFSQKHSPPSPFSPSLSPPSPFSLSPPSPFSPPVEPILRHQSSISEELLCTICASVLHDPMSLHCGHTFCQLCLAAMWKNNREPASAVDLHCPVCRSSWRNFPGVNIQLRNIIERTYPQRYAERAKDILPEDSELLARFKTARDKETQLKDKITPQLRRDEIRRLVTGLCCIFLVVLSLMMLLFSLILWAWSGAGGEFMRKPASQWSQEDVAEWVGGLGNWATNNYSHIFLGEHITGQRLLQLDEAALKAIGIKNDYRRQSILYGIQKLREVEYNTPRNFGEFKAAHRRQTLVIALFYSLWPRLTLFYTYAFNYYDIFLPFMRYHFPIHEDREGPSEPSYRELVAMFLEVLLIPHFLVMHFAWGWAGLHPWIAYPVIFHCLWSMRAEGKQVMSWLRSIEWASWQNINWRVTIPQLCKIIIVMTLKHLLTFTVLLFAVTLLWNITPHFICDFIFYCLVWNVALYAIGCAPFFRCLRHFGGNNFQARVQLIRRPAAQQQNIPNP